MSRQMYRKKPTNVIVAVQLNLETEGFEYTKWGSAQVCKPGDWIVNNEGDTYTVSKEVFEGTYRQEASGGPGAYVKKTPVWAEPAKAAGKIKTGTGMTNYASGDYLVYGAEEGEDGYAVKADKFESMYEPSEQKEKSTEQS